MYHFLLTGLYYVIHNKAIHEKKELRSLWWGPTGVPFATTTTKTCTSQSWFSRLTIQDVLSIVSKAIELILLYHKSTCAFASHHNTLLMLQRLGNCIKNINSKMTTAVARAYHMLTETDRRAQHTNWSRTFIYNKHQRETDQGDDKGSNKQVKQSNNKNNEAAKKRFLYIHKNHMKNEEYNDNKFSKVLFVWFYLILITLNLNFGVETCIFVVCFVVLLLLCLIFLFIDRSTGLLTMFRWSDMVKWTIPVIPRCP